ncbi:MFS transporter [Achromobacter aloeverae]|uniref:MFS transporter n=1 Tax=Achromobacter aloeverae TaxID=1750518 RepID=A0A4Q1HKE5_9BURK|nr:MFS transporter [Achromobacter aloeverae]RXN88106.1 MFS transporter [Achromobacter aloeverae]
MSNFVRTGVFRGAPGRVFLLLCAMYFIEYVDRVNLSVAAPLIKEEFGLSNTRLGVALSAFGYCYAVFPVICGYLGDRLGPRRMLAISGVLWALGTLLTGFAGGLAGLVFARLLVGTGEGGTIPVATLAMSNWVTRHRRGFAQGFTHSASRAAAALTPPLVVFLIPLIGWRGAFMAMGVASLAWVVVWYGYFRDDPRDHGAVTAAELAALPAFSQAGRGRRGNGGAGAPPVPWLALLRRILPVTLVFFAHAWALWMYLSWLPSFFVSHFHIDLKHSAFHSGAVFAAAVIGNTAGGVLTDWLYTRTGNLNAARRNVVILGFGGSIPFLASVLFLHNEIGVALCLAVALFFLELSAGPVFATPMDIAPAHAGVATGFVSTAAGLAAVISPITFGYLVDVTGSYTSPFALSIAILAFGIVMSFWMRPDRPLEPPAPGELAVHPPAQFGTASPAQSTSQVYRQRSAKEQAA